MVGKYCIPTPLSIDGDHNRSGHGMSKEKNFGVAGIVAGALPLGGQVRCVDDGLAWRSVGVYIKVRNNNDLGVVRRGAVAGWILLRDAAGPVRLEWRIEAREIG